MDEKTFAKVQQIMREVDTYMSVMQTMMISRGDEMTEKMNESIRARHIIYKRVQEILEEDK